MILENLTLPSTGNRVLVENLRLQARLGVRPSEQGREQTVDLSLEIGLPSARCFHSDDVDHTIDYTAVVDSLARLAVSRHFNLVEFLAEEIAAEILDGFGGAWVVVRLRKINVVPGARFVGVQIRRRRGVSRWLRQLFGASKATPTGGFAAALAPQSAAAEVAFSSPHDR